MRLRPLTDWECYARCYGQRGNESVRLVRIVVPQPPIRLTGEAVRRLFEVQPDEPEAEAA